MITLKDRFVGTLVGVLAGDALGAPYENQRADMVRLDLRERGGLHAYGYTDPWGKVRQVEAGQPTDDSELTALLAESLATHPEFDAEDIYRRLRSFIHGRISYLTEGEAYGSGGTLHSALKPDTYEESRAAFIRGEVKLLPSNGSLMRASPVALRWYGAGFSKVAQYAERQSYITHRHDHAVASCSLYSLTLLRVLWGRAVEEAYESARNNLPECSVVSETAMREVLRTHPTQPAAEEIWPHSGSALLSLRVALWAASTATDFRDGITKAVAIGGDTDTYAAIAGALLGARFGIGGIPWEWRKTLIGREKMESLAQRLYDIAV